MKNCVGVMHQKWLLLVNLNKIYAEYQEKESIGHDWKFCELRPKFVVPVTASQMQNVCVCQIHQNTKLITAAIPGGNHGDYKKILEKMVCSFENRDCMLHFCKLCPGRRAIHDYLTNLCTALDFSFEGSIEYKQWLHTDRTTLLTYLHTY